MRTKCSVGGGLRPAIRSLWFTVPIFCQTRAGRPAERTGDALSALLVFVGTYLAFNVEKFAFINILVVILWLFLTLGIARQHRQLPSPA